MITQRVLSETQIEQLRKAALNHIERHGFVVQLGAAEHLPIWAECAGTLTHRTDPQAGAEGMLFMQAAHASGADLISGFGSCHNAVGMSAEMMVMQQAYLRAARHLSRGIRTDDLRLATANLERVGPGGQFLDDDLTVELMRSDEFFHDDVFDLSGGHGSDKPMLARAHDRVEQLVDGYQSRLMVGVFQYQSLATPSGAIAALVVASIPTFLVFLFCQKIILRGIILPSLK